MAYGRRRIPPEKPCMECGRMVRAWHDHPRCRAGQGCRKGEMPMRKRDTAQNKKRS